MLKELLSYIPNITIPQPNGKPYLTRYYLLLKDREFGNCFLHHFRSSDTDVDLNEENNEFYDRNYKNYLLHNHPMKWSFSFVLTQGYWEERRNPDNTVSRRFVKPLSFNFFTPNVFHRVELVDEEKGAWTLFFTGSRKGRSWGFWNRITRVYQDFRTYGKAIL